MHNIYIIHQKAHHASLNLASKFDPKTPIWKTCLRQIYFIDGITGQNLESELKSSPLQLLKGNEAIQFLISVLCGLESPVLGETEVMGQFKNFLQLNDSSQHPLLSSESPIFQLILSEVKFFRDKYVRHLGSNSYGSLIRKELRDSKKVTVLGSGHFVGEILPWIKDKERIDIWCRNPERAEPFKQMIPTVEVFSLNDHSPILKNEALIIAAPICNTELLDKLRIQSHRNFDIIIDGRGENPLIIQKPLLNVTKRHVDLKSLTQSLEQGSSERIAKLLEIKNQINLRISTYLDKPKIRPQGWEDLCA